METQAGTIERITKEELELRLQKGEGIVIVDARGRRAYEASNIRPVGSVRIAPGSANGVAAQLPRDRLIVTV